MAAIEDNSCRVLLVEDNPGDVALVREAAHVAGINVDFAIARDGLEALDYLHKTGAFKDAPRPDMIVMDLNMPGMSGHELLRRLKTDPELLQVPVLVLTSSSAQQDIELAYALHANTYLVKPKDFQGMVALTRRVWDFWQEAAKPTMPN